MGGLTRPGLYTPPGIDPQTGQPIAPELQYYKSPGARALDFAKQQSAQVQPTTSSVEGSIDGTPATGTILPPAPNVPQFIHPSFRQAATDPTTGMMGQINPAETKLGKLVHILTGAAQGALAGWGTGNPGAGAAAAREIPFQEAQQRGQIQLQQAEMQPIQTPYGTLPAALAPKLLSPYLQYAGKTESAKTAAGAGVAKAEIGAGAKVQAEQIGKRFVVVPGVGVYDTAQTNEKGTPALIPGTSNSIMLTPELQAEYPQLPKELIGTRVNVTQLLSATPKVSTNTQSSTTDLMGNTQTVNTRVTGPQVVGGGTQAPAAAARQTPAATPSAANPLKPSGTVATPPKSTANSPIFQLPADVEQRITASGLKPQEQQYVRGLLSYQGQMPSPRARNYAATLATLTSLDPNFNAANYDSIRKTLMDYTPGGTVGQQVLAFNTAMRHAGLLSDAVDQLHNGNMQLANKIGTAISVQFGNNPVTNFNTIKTYLAGELAKGFGGGVATDSSRAEANAILSTIQSPQQLKGGLQSAVKLLQGKIGAQEDAYQATVKRPVSLLDGESHKVLQKLGLESGPSHIVTDRDGKRIGTVVNNQYIPDTK